MAKVMLVEDDNNLREIYEARLQAEGYTIVSARDGEEALVVAKQEQPDLIISDVMMPKISGFEMLDILRNTDGLRDTKVIMLTALGQSDDQQRADKLGADRYLVKSQVTLEDIIKVTHDLLEDTPAAAAPPPETPASAAPGPAATVPPASPPAVAAPEPVVEPPAEPPVVAEPEADPPTDSPSAAVVDAAATPTTSSPFSPVEVPAEPAATTTPAAEVTASEDLAVQSAAQEEASVEAKIEDFVAGASSEAVLPGSEPAASEEASVAEPVETAAPSIEPVLATAEPPPAEPIETAVAAPVVATEAATDASTTDDKIMANAVDALVNNAEETASAAEPASPTVISVAQSGATTTSSAPPEPPAPSVDIEAVPTETVGDGTTIAHKKIIKPIDSEPKEDLDVLLAKEAAKQTMNQLPVAPKVVVATNESGPVAATPPPTNPNDPNNIAL